MRGTAHRTTLLEGKFRPQVGAGPQVVRTRLAVGPELLAGPTRCATIVAPAGYGKSTLMAQWHATFAALPEAWVDVAWLNLDENDNDPPRLLKYLHGALGHCLPALATEAALEVVQTAPVPVVLEELGARLAAHGRPILLFIDDAHVLSNPAALEILDWVLGRAGRNLRTVVGSRQAVGGVTAELRVRRQLIEIDQRALAFDTEETRAFCATRLGEGLQGPPLARLQQRTEGWPAAVELLTLALNEAADPGQLIAEFTASDRGVLEYLGETVFDRLPPDERALAHALAQFDHFCAELVPHVTDSASPVLFGQLQRRQLFLIPLDLQGRWFRFHHLVGEYLRRHDPRSAAEIAASLVRGGRWLFQQGMADDAIDCAVRACDWELACEWLALAAGDAAQRRGDGANLLRWIPVIPRTVLDRYPLLRLSHVFSLLFNPSTGPALERELAALEALRDRMQADPAVDRRTLDELRCALPAMRMMWQGLRDDAAGLRVQAEQWLRDWPDAPLHYRGDVCNVAAFACKSEGEIAAGLRHCARGEAAHASDGGQFGVSWSRVLRALLLLKRGDYRAALAAADAGLRHVADGLYGHPEHTAYFQAIRASVLYDFDDVAGAEEALEAPPDALEDRGSSDFLLLTYLARARVQFHAGRVEEGLAALQLGRKLGARRHLPRVSVTLAGEECIWLCRLGRTADALELARAEDLHHTMHTQYDAVADKAARVAPRLLLALQPDRAVAQLSPAIERAVQKGYEHRQVELLILQAAALLRCGRAAEALEAWRLALELGERHGYRRVFLDDLDLIDPLNQAARGDERIQVPAWMKHAAVPSASRGEEALTRKELRILRYLETGASNREIADSLFVSEGTLKWHLHNVYRKLGCRNRAGAIANARRRGLLG